MRPLATRYAEANPIAAIRQYPIVVVVFAVVFAALGAVFAANQTDTFSASAGLVVEDARGSTLVNSRSADRERYVATQVAILESSVVAERASELVISLGVDISIDEFLGNTSIASSSESNFIKITFDAGSANEAQAGANAIGRAYEEVIQAALAEDAETAVAKLDDAIDSVVEDISALQAEVEALRTDNDDRVELDDQLAEIVAELVELRKQSAELEVSDEETSRQAVADLTSRIQQLSEELRSRLLVSDVEAGVPATAFLLRRQEDALARLSELALRRSQIEVDAQLAGNGVAFSTPAGLGKPGGIPISSTVVVVAAIGALVGAGIAYSLAQRRQRIEDRLEPEAILDAPLLSEVPRLPVTRPSMAAAGSNGADASLLPIVEDPASVHAEAFRVLGGVLTQRLGSARGETGVDGASAASQRGMIIAVCSPTIGEASSVVTTNTALAVGRSGHRVVLVDGDFGVQEASRLLSRLAQNATSEGLAEVLKGEISLDDALISVDVGGGRRVSLLRGGSADVAPPDFIGSQAAAEVFRKLADRYDLVILDLPPPFEVAYATAAIQNADGTLVVVRHRSRVGNLQELRHRLDLIGVTPLGYVYTDAPIRRLKTTRNGLFNRAAVRTQRRTSNAPKQNTFQPRPDGWLHQDVCGSMWS